MTATSKTLARLDALVWILIYGGLFAIVIGVASHGEANVAGWSLVAVGGVAAVAGIVLIFVRARLRERPEPGAQSDA